LNGDLPNGAASLAFEDLALAPFVHVPGLAADEGFIHFDFGSRPAKFHERAFLQGQPDSLEHEPRGFLRDAEAPVNLVGTDAVLAVHQHPDGRKPLVQAERRVLEDSAGLERKLLLRVPFVALPDSRLFEIDNAV